MHLSRKDDGKIPLFQGVFPVGEKQRESPVFDEDEFGAFMQVEGKVEIGIREQMDGRSPFLKKMFHGGQYSNFCLFLLKN